MHSSAQRTQHPYDGRTIRLIYLLLRRFSNIWYRSQGFHCWKLHPQRGGFPRATFLNFLFTQKIHKIFSLCCCCWVMGGCCRALCVMPAPARELKRSRKATMSSNSHDFTLEMYEIVAYFEEDALLRTHPAFAERLL